jgi:hypothetical protein
MLTKTHYIEHDDFNELIRLSRITLAQCDRQKTKAVTAELNHAIAVYDHTSIESCSVDTGICQLKDQAEQLAQTAKLIFPYAQKPLAVIGDIFHEIAHDIGMYRNPITDQLLPFVAVNEYSVYQDGSLLSEWYVDTSDYLVYEISFTLPFELEQTKALKTITKPFQLLNSPVPVKHPVPYLNPMPTDEPLEEFCDWLRSVRHNVTDSGKGYRIVQVKTGLPVFRSKSIRGSGKTSAPYASIKSICGVASSFYVSPSPDETIKALYNQKSYPIKTIRTEHGLQAALIIPDCVPLLNLSHRQQNFIDRLVSTIL